MKLNNILQNSLLLFFEELRRLTDQNLQEYKHNLIEQIYSSINDMDLTKQADYEWKNIRIKNLKIKDYLEMIFIDDILKIYRLVFLKSKLLSIQILPDLTTDIGSIYAKISPSHDIRGKKLDKVVFEFSYFKKLNFFDNNNTISHL